MIDKEDEEKFREIIRDELEVIRREKYEAARKSPDSLVRES